MSKHTAGPWWVTDDGIRDRGGYIAFVPHATHFAGQDERYEHEVAERKANACLIAEAPELLEALELLLENTETPPDRNCSCHIAPPCGDCVDYSSTREAINYAKTAIAKARGEV